MFVGEITEFGCLIIAYTGDAKKNGHSPDLCEIGSLELVTGNNRFVLSEDIPKNFKAYTNGNFGTDSEECVFENPFYSCDNLENETPTLDIGYLFSTLHEIGHARHFQVYLAKNINPMQYLDRIKYFSRDASLADVLECINQEYFAWEYVLSKANEIGLPEKFYELLFNHIEARINDAINVIIGDYRYIEGRKEAALGTPYEPFKNILQKIERYSGGSYAEMRQDILSRHIKWMEKHLGKEYNDLTE